MSILSIETATTVCGAALIRDGKVVAERWVDERSVHAEMLFGLVDGVLVEAGCAMRDLRAVAVSIGPGSFTGLRIGLSAAKGFHLALGIPLVEVPTLTALARRAVPLFGGRQGHILAALDARRDEIYCQLFAVHADRVVEAGDVRARTVQDVARELPAGEVLLTGDARHKLASAVEAVNPGLRLSLHVADAAVARCSPAEVARLGAILFEQNILADPRSLEPRYVKEVFLRSSQ